jgi:hypothetical protein
VTVEREGRLWVFKDGSKDLAEFLKTGEPAKQVTRPAAGPGGITLKSSDSATIDEYLLARDGFAVKLVGGRAWVFKAGSKDLAEFLKTGEPAKQVTRPAAGPGGITLKSSDSATIDEYLLARDGFAVKLVGGRAWVFKAGSKDLAEFLKTGEPAKQVTRPAAGPGGITLKSSDSATLDAYAIALIR